MVENVVFRELGDILAYEKQIAIGASLGLKINGPVYKSWEPSSKLDKRVINNNKLKETTTLELLLKSQSIILQYVLVTVRQVYYVLVSRQDIYNTKNEYRRVIRILKNGRLAGLINFDSIIDDTREAEKTPSWQSIKKILSAAVNQYRSDWWRDQPRYVEVWLEKRALRRILYPITNGYDVNLVTGGGYQSWSQVWAAKARFLARKGLKLKILYFGDLDPSGKDMPRDIRERFKTLGIDVDIIEVALTKDDILEYNLPKNPTKKKDTRKAWYIKKYGINYAVELDALPPEILREKVKTAIEEHCDLDLLRRNRIQDNIQKDLWKQQIDQFTAEYR